LAFVLTAGFLFGGLSCVMRAADVVGTGMTIGAATGLLGPATQGTTGLGAGLDLIADLIQFTPLGG
jgi:hypothetical protein